MADLRIRDEAGGKFTSPQIHCEHSNLLKMVGEHTGKSMIELTDNPIDYQTVVESVRSNAAGAAVLFLGTIREYTGDIQTASLEYDAYPQMAHAAMAKLREEAIAKWGLVDAAIVHRKGPLELGDVAVAVATSSAHRRAAFEAGQWLIDTLKQRVPIWKKELYANGQTEWVHPTQKSPAVKTGPNE